MKKFALFVLFLLGIPLAIFTGLTLYGMTLPENHQETLTVELNAPVSEVWGLIRDYQGMTAWWEDVQGIEEQTEADGTQVTWNTDKHGERVGFITIYEVPQKKLTRRIYDPKGDLPYGGTWSFEIDATSPEETSLLIVEEGFVKPPFFRAVAKLFFGTRATLDSFARAIRAKTDAPDA